jgi:hypothetical protein
MRKTKDLSQAIARTYFALRMGLAVMAFAFPILLWIGGHFLADIPLQGSMSAYYHASLHALSGGPAGQGVMRDVFVGILITVGVILFLYQGVTRPEDFALNLAGILALGIALFPMQWSSGPKNLGDKLHGAFAVSFFVCIAYVAVFRSVDTLSLIRDKARRERYRRLYVSVGWAMVGFPALAFVLALFPAFMSYKIFLMELFGIYAFGFYWVLKTRELSETNFDRKAADGNIQVAPHQLSDAVSRIPVQESSQASGGVLPGGA